MVPQWPKWKCTKTTLPPRDVPVLGWDALHDRHYVCIYVEDLSDDGDPLLRVVEDDSWDYNISYWVHLPSPPNVEVSS